MDIEKEVEEIIDLYNEVSGIEAVELNVPWNTTVSELIEFCDALRDKGYESKLTFTKYREENEEEKDTVMVYLEKE